MATLVLLIASTALAQISTNYDLRWWTFHAGSERQSATYRIQDSVGQMAADTAGSATYRIESGFIPGLSSAGPVQPTATPTTTATPNPNQDAFELDDACAQAKTINTDASLQNHNFHDEGDTDWIRFTAQANKTYIIQVENVGTDSDAIVYLHDTCATDPASADNNAFGTTVTIEWDSTKNGDYFIQIRQFDPAKFGATANYRVSVRVDQTPPSEPTNPRCIAINDSTIAVQWTRSPERDVRRYRINYSNISGTFSGNDNVTGGDTTYYELGSLTANDTYKLSVQALDFSNNPSPFSGEVQCKAQNPVDSTMPQVTVQQPTASTIYTTTAGKLTFTGLVSDAGNNLSRVQVRNQTGNTEGWDYTLEGGNDNFRVEDIPLNVGDNSVDVTVYDAAGLSSKKTVIVRRLGDSPGAVIIIAGHNETFGLQTNIYYSTNRAYRVFKSGGFSADDIFYIAPIAQDADNDGVADTDALASPAAFQDAIVDWAKNTAQVGPNKPLFIYMMDHGLENKFCVTGCGAGKIVTPDELDSWLRTLETDTGVDEVTVIYEACVSGSFIAKEGAVGTISKVNRVIITSTGANNNAYASAQGAYFSDTFFSCVADSNSLLACFNEAKSAVSATGVNQTPLLDDNGDGVYNAGDGSVAQARTVTKFFSSLRPVIAATSVEISGSNGTLSANVTEGAEEVELVWAAVFPPNFTEPTDVTLNLSVPVVRLEPVPNQEGQFSVPYPNGFTEQGDYNIIFYAQDRLGINATPKTAGEGLQIFLPLVEK